LSNISRVAQILLWSLLSFPTSESSDGSDGLDDGEADGGDEDTGDDGANEVDDGADDNGEPPVRASDVEEEILSEDVE